MTTNHARSHPAAGRLLALDWLRGLAVLVMMECHVFNALLAPQYRPARWFSALTWLNGLVAPAFLLVSGAVLSLNLQKHWSDVVGGGASGRKLWRRVGQIFVVAYLLHLPTPLLWQFFGPRGPHLVELWTKMDILQCVAGSLALVLALVTVTRWPELHRWVCVGLGVAAAVSVAAVARWAEGTWVPNWLLNYLWPTGVGKFPLVPWAAFPLLGAWLGPAVFVETSTARQCIRALVAGIAFIIAGKFMVSTQPYDAAFVFSRLGWVLIGLAACCWLRESGRGTGWLLQFGQFSLWSYTVHLIIVYGSCISLGLDTLLGPRFSPLATGVWLAAVVFVTALVVGWRAKSLQRRAAVRIMPAR